MDSYTDLMYIRYLDEITKKKLPLKISKFSEAQRIVEAPDLDDMSSKYVKRGKHYFHFPIDDNSIDKVYTKAYIYSILYAPIKITNNKGDLVEILITQIDAYRKANLDLDHEEDIATATSELPLVKFPVNTLYQGYFNDLSRGTYLTIKEDINSHGDSITGKCILGIKVSIRMHLNKGLLHLYDDHFHDLHIETILHKHILPMVNHGQLCQGCATLCPGRFCSNCSMSAYLLQDLPDKEVDVCSICHDAISKECMVTTSCGHHYHKKCVMESIEKCGDTSAFVGKSGAAYHYKCPLCRQITAAMYVSSSRSLPFVVNA